MHPVFAAELVNTTGGVHDFLLTRVKRMALGADFDVQGPAVCRSGLEGVSTAAGDLDFRVGWMNVFFHKNVLEIPVVRYSRGEKSSRI